MRSMITSDAVAGVVLTREESEQALKAWCQRHGIQDEAGLEDYRRSQALTDEDARWQAELPLRIDRHCLEHFSHRAEQRFLQRKTGLDRVVYSLIRVKEAGMAQELYLRISEGECSFSDLAAEHSLGPERVSHGIVGPVPLTQAHPRLVELLRTAQNGQLFPPVLIAPWWLVVRLEEIQPASFDENMKTAMARELFDEWIANQLRSQLAGLTTSKE
jgi:parvulin-like peptidyl-prolyl isomerase